MFIFDLDRTLWDHHDATILKGPFKVKSNLEIEDSFNEKVRLYPCVPEIFRKLKEKGKKIAIASWNEPQNPLALLRLFGLDKYIDYTVVEPHPNKTLMIMKILTKLGAMPEEAIFFDDNEYIVENVRSELNVDTVIIGKDVDNICFLKEILK